MGTQAVQLLEMMCDVQEAECVLWCHKSKFVVTTQKRFHTEFSRELLSTAFSYKRQEFFELVAFLKEERR
jgi:hypothetical protein